MTAHLKRITTFFALFAALLLSSAAIAGDGLEGWGADSEFQSLYDTFEQDRVKGKFVGFVDITPLEGMAEGVAVLVESRDDGEVVTGILGPHAYVQNDHLAHPIRKGDKLKLYGAWTEIDGEEMMIATKIKYDDNEQYKVRRTKDGVAYWNMPAEEREAELRASEADEEKMQQD